MLRKIVWTLIAVITVGVVLARVFGPRVLLWTERGRWEAAAPGIETRVASALGVTGRVWVTAVRADARCPVRVVDARRGRANTGATAADVCPPAGAAINANFFDTDNLDPIGYVLTDGVNASPFAQRPLWAGDWALFSHANGKASISVMGASIPRGTRQAVEAGPILIDGGTICQFRTRPAAPRAAVGIDGTGHIIFAVTDGYITFEQWAACLKNQFDCVDALNLDGGPSAQLAVRGNRRIDVETGESVPIFLTVEALPLEGETLSSRTRQNQ